MYLAEHGRPARVAAVIVSVVALPVLAVAHVGHGLVGLPIRFEAIGMDVLATLAGAWAADRWLAPLTQRFRGGDRARVFLFAYAALLVIWGWRPLLPVDSWDAMTRQLTPTHLIPLASLAERVDVFSAVHVLQQFALYVPVGAVLAVWPLRATGSWRHLWPAVRLAAIIEVGHLVVSDRYFDVTNAIIAMAGLGVAWIVVRRSGYVPYGVSLS
jgi:hypothetical protein